MRAQSVTVEPASALTHGQLALVTAGRLALTVAYRIVYPLQPFLALHLEVDLRTVSMLVSAQVLASLASPLGGALADWRGPRATMQGGLALFCAGVALCAVSRSFGGFLAGYILIGLAVALYGPAAQAYLSARTPYTERGWVLGLFETSWAAAALIGVAPLMQLVQATGDVAATFWLLLAAGAASLPLIRFALPPPAKGAQPGAFGASALPTPTPGQQTARQRTWESLRSRSVVAVIGMLALIMCAADMVLVVQGAWLKTRFNASEGQLGQVFGMLGIAELIGAIGSALLVDRLGKKRSVIVGFGLTALCVAALPFSEGRWPLYLPLFFAFDLFFEFSIVSIFPLISGVAPTARGTILALSSAVVGVGRALGAFVSEPLWSAFGFGANGLLGAALMLAGVLLCMVFVRETERDISLEVHAP